VKKFLLSVGLFALLASPCLAADPSCFVTRYCAYPPPESVSCFSQAGNCVLGSDYVWCDGVYHRCSTPPPPLDDCFTLNGTSCLSNGAHKNCTSEGFTYECTCFFGAWSCPY
jgi:hypothetical protein